MLVIEDRVLERSIQRYRSERLTITAKPCDGSHIIVWLKLCCDGHVTVWMLVHVDGINMMLMV